MRAVWAIGCWSPSSVVGGAVAGDDAARLPLSGACCSALRPHLSSLLAAGAGRSSLGAASSVALRCCRCARLGAWPSGAVGCRADAVGPAAARGSLWPRVSPPAGPAALCRATASRFWPFAAAARFRRLPRYTAPAARRRFAVSRKLPARWRCPLALPSARFRCLPVAAARFCWSPPPVAGGAGGWCGRAELGRAVLPPLGCSRAIHTRVGGHPC